MSTKESPTGTKRAPNTAETRDSTIQPSPEDLELAAQLIGHAQGRRISLESRPAVEGETSLPSDMDVDARTLDFSNLARTSLRALEPSSNDRLTSMTFALHIPGTSDGQSPSSEGQSTGQVCR